MYGKEPAAAASENNAFIAALLKAQTVGEFEVWPDNWASFTLFCSLQTQWRVGMSGATGLDYAAMYPLLDKAASSKDEWYAMFEDIQVLEREALAVMNEKD